MTNNKYTHTGIIHEHHSMCPRETGFTKQVKLIGTPTYWRDENGTLYHKKNGWGSSWHLDLDSVKPIDHKL